MERPSRKATSSVDDQRRNLGQTAIKRTPPWIDGRTALERSKSSFSQPPIADVGSDTSSSFNIEDLNVGGGQLQPHRSAVAKRDEIAANRRATLSVASYSRESMHHHGKRAEFRRIDKVDVNTGQKKV